MKLYQVNLFNATCGLEVTDGVVVHAAPFLKKSVGLPFRKVENWIKTKGGTIRLVTEDDTRLHSDGSSRSKPPRSLWE